MQGIEFWAVNTDVQALAHHSCSNRMQIGSEVTRGLGCGGNPELGQAAAVESEEALKQVCSTGLAIVDACCVLRCLNDSNNVIAGVIQQLLSFIKIILEPCMTTTLSHFTFLGGEGGPVS